MKALRCMNCGELIPVSFINDAEKVAFCPKCGEFTLATDEQRRAETHSVRELLSDEPPSNVTIGLCRDGAREYAIAPADLKRQVLNLLCALAALAFSLAAMFGLASDFAETAQDLQIMKLGVSPRAAGFTSAALLFLSILGSSVSFLLSLVFFSRLTHLRLVVGNDELLAQELWLGRVRTGRTRRFARDRESVVAYETAAGAFAVRKTGRPAKHIVRVCDSCERELMSCRDALTAQYVRAVVLEWLGKVGRFRPFACRRCGAEIASSGVDMKADLVSCPSCGFSCDVAIAGMYRDALRQKRAPTDVAVLEGGKRCLHRPNWRKDARFAASVPILLSFSLSCWKMARHFDGHSALWLVLGFAFPIGGPLLMAISLALNRFRRFEIACSDERVICEARGLFGTRRRDVPLAGTCVALKLARDGSRLGLVTNLKDKNEQITELARHLLPDACAELANWLNARLLKVGRGKGEQQ